MGRFGAAALAALAVWPAAADDGAAGEAIARRWCAECHVVAADQAAAGDAAPSFRAIANDAARTESALRAWLADPHPPMPNPGLSADQIDAVIAYIATLRE
jgi:mono/diheme cytochrome c family protein